jgi:hypothetical protein
VLATGNGRVRLVAVTSSELRFLVHLDSRFGDLDEAFPDGLHQVWRRPIDQCISFSHDGKCNFHLLRNKSRKIVVKIWE